MSSIDGGYENEKTDSMNLYTQHKRVNKLGNNCFSNFTQVFENTCSVDPDHTS